MMQNQLMLKSLEELKALRLSPTDELAVQLILTVQNFLRSDWRGMSNKPFDEWSVSEICRAMKVKVTA